MDLLSVIRRWRFRQGIPIREIVRRTGLSRNKRGVDRLYEGSGLGLYIVRAVADLHHGDVSYHLVNGNQVAFELSIPA